MVVVTRVEKGRAAILAYMELPEIATSCIDSEDGNCKLYQTSVNTQHLLHVCCYSDYWLRTMTALNGVRNWLY